MLKPNGVIRAFSGSRTAHRLCKAMLRVGFTNISVEEWLYLNGSESERPIKRKHRVGWLDISP